MRRRSRVGGKSVNKLRRATDGLSGADAVKADRLAKRGRDLIPVAILVVVLFTLLALSVWFAGYGWTHIGGDPVPSYAYVAIAGGAVVSIVVGVGLMALVFYSSRHGYDDLSGGELSAKPVNRIRSRKLTQWFRRILHR